MPSELQLAWDKIKRQRREIRGMQLALERKNKELDALHFVWCSGGCRGGMHRFNDIELTDEIVEESIRNTNRLVTWHVNKKYRDWHKNGSKGEPTTAEVET